MEPEELQKQQDEKLKREQEQYLNDLRWILGDARGRRFITKLLFIYCHWGMTSFSESASMTAFNEGERNIGNRIYADLIEAKESAFSQMLREWKSKQNQDRESGGGNAGQ